LAVFMEKEPQGLSAFTNQFILCFLSDQVMR